MLLAYSTTLAEIARDAGIGVALSLYVYAIIRIVSKKHYELLVKRFGNRDLARYLTRKFVHIAGAGPATLLAPLVFSEPFTPSILALCLALLLARSRRKGSIYYWFQETGNRSEIIFIVSWALSVLVLWYISPWLAFFPAFLLSVGDGVTGYVRGIIHGRRVKSWEGTLAMLVATAIPGYLVIGAAGVAASIAASLAERSRILDDNISIPLASTIVLLLAIAAKPLLLAP